MSTLQLCFVCTNISNHLIQCTYKKCTICSGMWTHSVQYRVKSLDLTMHLSNSVYDRCTLKSKIWKNTYALWALNQMNSRILPEEVSDKAFNSVSLAFLYPTGTGNYTDTYWPGYMNGCQFTLELCIFHLLLFFLIISVSTHSIKRTFFDSIQSWWWLLPQSLSLITQCSFQLCVHTQHRMEQMLIHIIIILYYKVNLI